MNLLIAYCGLAYLFVGLMAVRHFERPGRRWWMASVRAKLTWVAFVALAPLVLPAAVAYVVWNW